VVVLTLDEVRRWNRVSSPDALIGERIVLKPGRFGTVVQYTSPGHVHVKREPRMPWHARTARPCP
jgi:hypothetical protein